MVSEGGSGTTLNKEEARRLADEALEPLRSLSYEQLLAEYFKHPHTSEVKGHDGQEYNLEVEAMWDSRKQRTLRVFACADDGSLRWGLVTSSVCSDFIIGPDGAHVDE